MNPKISIVINIYNLNFEYVKRSVDSVKNQNFDNYECIIIDDGSCKELTYNDFYNEICKDRRFRYFYHKNKGISLSRNKGIKESKGEYIFFLDGDDFFVDNSVILYMDKLIKMNSESDIFHFNFEKIKNNNKKNKNFKNNENFICIDNNETSMKLSNFTQIQSMKCMYKISFILSNNLFFYNNRKRNEDVYFHLITKTLANKITFSNRIIYYYDTSREDSISNIEDKKQVYKEFIYYCIKAFKFLKPKKKSMFFLYIIYYQYQFLGNNFEEKFKVIFFMNNYFIENKIGISIKDILINKLLWNNKFGSKLKNIWEIKKKIGK